MVLDKATVLEMYSYVIFALILATLASAENCALVDVANILTIFPNGNAVAGDEYNFTVILQNRSMQPVCSLYDPLLTVKCLGITNQPFCQPFGVRPLGNGVYNFTMVPTTLKAIHKPWPPAFGSTGDLSREFLTGNNSIHILYDSVDIPGSPFPVIVEPSPDVSMAYSVVNPINPPSGQVGQTFIAAYFYQIMDKYTNWIRTPEVIDSVVVRSSNQDVAVSWSWWQNWWIQIEATSERSGTFELSVHYRSPDGNEQPFRIQGPGGLGFTALIEVTPGPLDPENFLVEGPQEVFAGSTFTLTIQARDKYFNPTTLIPSSADPSTMSQKQSLLEVSVNGTQNLGVIGVNNTLDGSGFLAVHLKINVSSTYRLDIIYQGNIVAELLCKVLPASPSPIRSSLLIPSTVEAGIVSMEARLFDNWWNPTTGLATISLQDTERLSYSVYRQASANQWPLLFSTVLTRVGVYTASFTVEGQIAKVVNITVLPYPEISLQMSQVTGYGAGAPLDGPAATLISAGASYIAIVTLRDMYGNILQGGNESCVLRIDGPAPAHIGLTIRNGSREYTYTVYVVGSYTVVVETADRLLHRGYLQARPANPIWNQTLIATAQATAAGDLFYVSLNFRDAFGNPATTTGSLIVVLRGYDNQQAITKNITLSSVTSAVADIRFEHAGIYAGVCYVNGVLIGNRTFLVQVTPTTPATAIVETTGLNFDLISMDYMFYDVYGNKVADARLLSDFTLLLQPSMVWEANITAEAHKCAVTLWHEPSTQNYSLLSYYKGQLIHTSNFSGYTSADSRHKDSVRIGRGSIVAMACGSACLGLAITFLLASFLFNWTAA